MTAEGTHAALMDGVYRHQRHFYDLTRGCFLLGRDQLIAEGRYPSADAVRAALGNTGSKSTIHRYLKELGGDASTACASRRTSAVT